MICIYEAIKIESRRHPEIIVIDIDFAGDLLLLVEGMEQAHDV